MLESPGLTELEDGENGVTLIRNSSRYTDC